MFLREGKKKYILFFKNVFRKKKVKNLGRNDIKYWNNELMKY